MTAIGVFFYRPVESLRFLTFPNWGLILLVPALLGSAQLIVSVVPAKSSSSAEHSCIALVVQRHFPTNSTVGIFTTDVYEDQSGSDNPKSRHLADSLVQHLSLNRQFSFVSLKMTISNKSECYCPDGLAVRRRVDYAILMGTDDEIVTCIKAFCFGTLTTAHSHFAVFLEKIKAGNSVDTVLETFWIHQQLSVIVLVTNQQGELDIYSWFPLDVAPSVKIVDQCDGKVFRYNEPLFALKLPHNLNGKVIKVGTMAIPPFVCKRMGGGYAGLEIDIMEAMASALNFTAVYMMAQDLTTESDVDSIPWRNNYGLWKVLYLRALSGDIDIAFGGLTMRPNLVDDLGYTQPYLRNAIEFWVTQDLVMSNEMKGWVAAVILQMVVVHSCITLTMHLVKLRIKRDGKDFGATAILVWAILSEQPCKISTLSPRQLLLWTTSAFFVINMNTAYKSFLTAVLARPLFVEKIQTVREMIDSDLPFILKTPIAENDNGSLSPQEHDKILKKMTTCVGPIQTCLVNLIPIPQHCFTSFTFVMRFVEGVLPDRSYHSLERKVAFFDFSFFTPKNFFLTKKMTTLIHRSSQAGLIDFWTRKTLRNHQLCDVHEAEWRLLRGVDADRSVSHHSENVNVPLRIGHLNQSFLLLCLGLCVAGVVFVLELLLASNLCRLMWPRLRTRCPRQWNFSRT